MKLCCINGEHSTLMNGSLQMKVYCLTSSYIMKLKIELLSVVVMKESTQTSTQTCTMVSEDISKSFFNWPQFRAVQHVQLRCADKMFSVFH